MVLFFSSILSSPSLTISLVTFSACTEHIVTRFKMHGMMMFRSHQDTMGSSGHPLVGDEDGAALVLPGAEVDELALLVSHEARLPGPLPEPGDISADYAAPSNLTPATGECEYLLLLT